MSKWSETVTSFDRIGELLRQALRKCHQGRPGVVHLDVPENLIDGKGEAGPILSPRQYRRVDPIHPSPDLVERAARMLAAVVTPGRKSDRQREYEVDVLGTRNVLDACVAAGVRRLVVSSSGAAYGVWHVVGGLVAALVFTRFGRTTSAIAPEPSGAE